MQPVAIPTSEFGIVTCAKALAQPALGLTGRLLPLDLPTVSSEGNGFVALIYRRVWVLLPPDAAPLFTFCCALQQCPGSRSHQWGGFFGVVFRCQAPFLVPHHARHAAGNKEQAFRTRYAPSMKHAEHSALPRRGEP